MAFLPEEIKKYQSPQWAAQFFAAFKEDLERITQALKEEFEAHEPFINEVAGHILFAGGKRIRPLLTVCAGRICGLDSDELFRLAAVPEYLHAASLLHDDVVDEGEKRRNKLPAYKIWGNKAAILVGDYLYAKAIDLAARFGYPEIDSSIARTVALMAEGEVLQLLRAKGPELSEAVYYQIIHRKTAALIGSSCEIGAILAGAPEPEVQALLAYGLKLGNAFQILDDVLDYTAEEDELGKGLGTDLAEGKITLPIVIALSRLSGAQKEKLLGILAGSETHKENFKWVKKILTESGSIIAAKKRAAEMIGEACKGLEIFVPSPTLEQLKELAWFVLYRRK